MVKDNQLIVCGGWDSKVGPGRLNKILKHIKQKDNSQILIDFDTTDDAAIFKVNDETAIIQTIDFFPSMVNDPYTFGQIAAANALSDVWAMGGKVVSALNIVAFPDNLDDSVMEDILAGGLSKVNEGGGFLAGGHTISDHNVKYGLSVNGMVNPQHILRNNTCELGDQLILTKPLGVGILTSAHNGAQLDDAGFAVAIDTMCQLNKYASEIIVKYDTVTACTDITGFGLLGHLHEFLHDQFSAALESDEIPILSRAYEFADELMVTSGGQRNRKYLEKLVDFTFEDTALEEILYDPQTSGGLLFSIKPTDTKKVLQELNAAGISSSVIGQIVPKRDKEIIVN